MSELFAAGIPPPTVPMAVRRWRALVLLSAAQFMVVLDAVIVNVALPSIQRDVGFSEANLQWVFNAYALAFGGLLLLGGRVADLLGRRRLFAVGVALFTVASLLAGLSSTQWELITARAVQGVAAAIISPAALSMLTSIFSDPAERNKALGIWGALGAVGATVGSLAGGVLTKSFGWEWIFFVNIPIGIAALAATRAMLPESRATSAGGRFDLAGATTVTGGLVAIVYAIVRAPELGWGAARTIIVLALGVALLLAFVAVEWRSASPLLRLGILRQCTVAGANIAGFLAMAAMFSTFFILTLYMQQVLGYSALQAGAAYLPLALTVIVASTVAAQLVMRLGVKAVLVVGMAIAAAGLAALSRVPANGHFASDLLPAFFLVAIGLGLSFVPISIAAFAGIADAESGLASGLINTSQQVGGALGVAVLSTVATSHARAALASAPATELRHVLADSFDRAFTVGAGIAVFGALIAIMTVRRRDTRRWTCGTPFGVTAAEPRPAE